MKKILIAFTILCIVGLMAVMGFQELQTTGIHIMDGKTMTDHEMPSNHCDAKNCLVSSTPVMLFASLIVKEFAKEFPATLILATTLLLIGIFVPRKTNRSFAFIPIEIFSKDRSAVVFRE